MDLTDTGFGKDLGVVHEAVITGRKNGAGQRFWAALAHSSEAFKMVIPLAKHVALVEKYQIPITRVSNAAVLQVQGFLNYMYPDERCLDCHPPLHERLGLGPPTDQRENMGLRLNMGLEKVCGALDEIGVNPLELSAIILNWGESGELRDGVISTRYGVRLFKCLSPKEFIKGLSVLQAIREFEVQLRGVSTL